MPGVENGDEIATQMRSAIASIGDEFASARDSLEGLSTDDPAAFTSSLTELGTALTEAGASVSEEFDRLAGQYPAADLDAAAAEAESCRKVLG